MPFTSFTCLITLVWTSNTMLNRSGKSGHPCLVPELQEKASSLLPLNMMFAMGSSGSGRSPGEGNGKLTPVFLPGKSHEQRSLVGYSPWGRNELNMTG